MKEFHHSFLLGRKKSASLGPRQRAAPRRRIADRGIVLLDVSTPHFLSFPLSFISFCRTSKSWISRDRKEGREAVLEPEKRGV